jgi:signal transduction histidine kinase
MKNIFNNSGGEILPAAKAFQTRLSRRSEGLLQEWLERRQNGNTKPSLDRKSDRVWLDHLPQVLSEVIESIAPAEEPEAEPARDHVKQRNHYGFSAEDAVRDLQLLGAMLREELEAFLSENADIAPATGLYLCGLVIEVIDALVLESVQTLFALRRKEQQMRENVFRRKLDHLSEAYSGTCEAVDGYSHDLKGCTDTLIRLTEVIRKKMGAEADPLLNALGVGLRYNHKILADLEALSNEDCDAEFHPVDLSAMVKDIWSRIAFPGEMNARCGVEWYASDSVELETHPLVLERILSNLIDNAVQHGCRSQTVGFGWWRDSENAVRFEIENSVPTEVLCPDARTDWSRVPVFKSEGTGISVIRSLAEDLGGELLYRRVGADRVRACLRLATAHPPKG